MASENDDDMGSISMFNKSSNTSDPFFTCSWDPIVSQSESLAASSMASHYHLVMENHGICGTSHVSQYQLDPSFVSFDGGNLCQMVGPLGLPPNYALNVKAGNERGLTNALPSLDEEALGGCSPHGIIRKRAPESDPPLKSCKNGDEEPRMDLSSEGCDGQKEQDVKKQKTEQNTGRGKQAAKQENYIHVRSRRGQATNSHSLAERVRREKISERMRLLQELVPGCNKITGKAVMLDEIINYVQSLQQQVEFLSMKLATVNPELNLELDRILSKDIPSASASAAAVGFGPGTNSFHAFFPGTTSGIPNTNPRTVLHNELQHLFQMGFYSDGFGPNGRPDAGETT